MWPMSHGDVRTFPEEMVTLLQLKLALRFHDLEQEIIRNKS